MQWAIQLYNQAMVGHLYRTYEHAQVKMYYWYYITCTCYVDACTYIHKYMYMYNMYECMHTMPNKINIHAYIQYL